MPYVKKKDLEELELILKQLVDSGEMKHTNFNDIIKIQDPDRTITINERDVTKFIKEKTSGFRRMWIVHKAESGLKIIKNIENNNKVR
ncbi:hypothetical protein KAU33_04165 [Candidatus Dependentiae bacterium]|nr:hypothetical protein [Candidatus Dependentiae bacterium]